MKMKNKGNLNLFHAKFGIKFRGFCCEIYSCYEAIAS